MVLFTIVQLRSINLTGKKGKWFQKSCFFTVYNNMAVLPAGGKTAMWQYMNGCIVLEQLFQLLIGKTGLSHLVEPSLNAVYIQEVSTFQWHYFKGGLQNVIILELDTYGYT